MNDDTIKPTQNDVDANKCTLIADQAGFCNNFGKELIKKPWSSKVKYDTVTGEPYQEYCFTCPNAFSNFTK